MAKIDHAKVNLRKKALQSVHEEAWHAQPITEQKRLTQALALAKRDYAICRTRCDKNRCGGKRRLALALDLDIKTKRLRAARAAAQRFDCKKMPYMEPCT